MDVNVITVVGSSDGVSFSWFVPWATDDDTVLDEDVRQRSLTAPLQDKRSRGALSVLVVAFEYEPLQTHVPTTGNREVNLDILPRNMVIKPEPGPIGYHLDMIRSQLKWPTLP